MLDMSDVQVEQAQEEFTGMLGDIQRIAGHAFGHLDPEAREDAVAEAVALCWKNHLHCVAEGKDIGARSLAHFAVQGVKSGRALSGSSATDVLSRRTQVLGRVCVLSLSESPADEGDDRSDSGWWNCAQALVDKRVWERPLERTRIDLDYAKFLGLPAITGQERKVFDLLARGHRTCEIAHRLEVSAPRVCQVKNALAEKLVEFFGRGIKPDRRVTHAGRRR